MLNKTTLIGHLGNDPEIRYQPSGGQVTNITLATTFKWKKKEGQKQENTEWHRVVFFNKLAEISGQYLKKGSQVYIEGRIQTRKWQDSDGKDRYSTEIIATELHMLGSKPEGNKAPKQTKHHEQKSNGYAPADNNNYPPDFDDDIPF